MPKSNDFKQLVKDKGNGMSLASALKRYEKELVEEVYDEEIDNRQKNNQAVVQQNFKTFKTDLTEEQLKTLITGLSQPLQFFVQEALKDFGKELNLKFPDIIKTQITNLPEQPKTIEISNFPKIKEKDFKPQIKVESVFDEKRLGKALAKNLNIPEFPIEDLIKIFKEKITVRFADEIMKPSSSKVNSLPVRIANPEEIGQSVKFWIPDNPATGKGQDRIREQLTIQHSGTPTPFNVTVGSINTEYSQALPAGTKRFRIYAMNDARTSPHSKVLRLSYVTLGDSDWASETYIPIPRGHSVEEGGLNLSGTTLFFTSPASCKVIILAWN